MARSLGCPAGDAFHWLLGLFLLTCGTCCLHRLCSRQTGTPRSLGGLPLGAPGLHFPELGSSASSLLLASRGARQASGYRRAGPPWTARRRVRPQAPRSSQAGPAGSTPARCPRAAVPPSETGGARARAQSPGTHGGLFLKTKTFGPGRMQTLNLCRQAS